MSIEGVLFNKNITKLCVYPTARDAVKYVIPKSVVIIAEGVFGSSGNLSSVVVKNNKTKFEDSDGEGVSSFITFYCINNSDVYRYCKKYNLRIGNIVDATIPLTMTIDLSSVETAKVEEYDVASISSTINGLTAKTVAPPVDSYQLKAQRANQWQRQGLCKFCGGKLGGVFGKKCKSCGKPQ